MHPQPLRARAERNRAALRPLLTPALATALTAPPLARPVLDQGELIDLDLGGGRYYGGDARQLARQQVGQFLKSRGQHQFCLPFQDLSSFPGTIEPELRRQLLQAAQVSGVAELPPPHQGSEDMLLIFGIGLGYHILRLVEATGARYVLCIDTHAEFLNQSLYSLDWASVMATVHGRGGALALIVTEKTDELAQAIGLIVEKIGIGFFDGALIFRHKEAPPLVEALERTLNDPFLGLIRAGFYEDEKLMIRNSFRN